MYALTWTSSSDVWATIISLHTLQVTEAVVWCTANAELGQQDGGAAGSVASIHTGPDGGRRPHCAQI